MVDEPIPSDATSVVAPQAATDTDSLRDVPDADTAGEDDGGATAVTSPSRWARLRERTAGLVADGRRQWRTSLQFRVVLTTLLVGTVVVVALQSFLYGRIADGLVQTRIAAAEVEAANGAHELRAKLAPNGETDVSTQQIAFDVVTQQESQNPDQTRTLILTRAIDNTHAPTSDPTAHFGVSLDVVPTHLRKAIAADPTHQQVQIVPYPKGAGSVPAVVVGTQIQIPDAGPYELYYLFPMQREQDIMAMVWRVFVAGAIALVGALGLLAFIVTRLVVEPLRQASEVATRLSDGHLNERMLVRGEDDIARLATAFNDMAEHLQGQIQQLETLSRVQQRFVSDVSHELRTPLTTIHMASALIYDQRHDFEPMVERTAELLHTQVERFEALLGDLLEISRFDAGGAALEADPVDLRVIVARVASATDQLSEAKGSEIVLVGDDEPRVAAVDSRRVERILRNLLVNAVEHGEGRPVTIELGSDEDAVAVVVADQGIGLKPGEADLVFNRFWRADPSRKRTTGGTGLGLAISLEDAHLHHGRLQAWGKPGAGSRFRLTLPRVSGAVVDDSPLPLEPSAPTPDGMDAPVDADAVPEAAPPEVEAVAPPEEPTPSGPPADLPEEDR
ncbi:MtrAB system histidine kinase MtrB [Mobilicoccus pelagius]|uniref:Sensor histidine kinase MtrB n=1 Tax=Mobilicoccus pelagius NBRC 104925 TaxID=1089455 RepID=H5URW2_9MICO|nr:MtrAB system histidine kinase MtrB [Mobilicoccus pelagius]GAB48470.1 two-component histidine kinase MtrB [Mobilicoccus pelagius NBRC 104925]